MSERRIPWGRRAIADFEREVEFYRIRNELFLEAQYSGPIWELRRELGSLELVRNPERVPEALMLTEAEYRSVLESPLVYSVVELVLQLDNNMRGGLMLADRAAEAVLAELARLEAR